MSRRNRDNPTRDSSEKDTLDASTAAQVRSSYIHSGLALPSVPGSAMEVLEQGHPWLRFPAALEIQFQADTLEPRRKLLLICGLIGFIAICLGSINLAELVPDAAELSLRNLYWILAASVLSAAGVWATPKRWRHNWQAETFTAFAVVILNAGIIYTCMMSQVDTAFTHAAALVSSVMYTCIAARLRFAWSLGCTLISFVAYVTFVRGTTPQQELIVQATTELMALSYAFVLVANYEFEYRERRNWLLRRLSGQQRDALRETSERLHNLSIHDPLTHLFNRRQFDCDLGLAWSKAVFAKEPMALLMVDVDFFKHYNDTYGHPAGDACLIKIGEALTKVAQSHGGVAARLGGEEFGLLLPGRTADEAVEIGVALCNAVRSARIGHRASTVSRHVTVSVGAAQMWPGQGCGVQHLLDLADRALYQAKQAGRDRVMGTSGASGADGGAISAMSALQGTVAPSEPLLVTLPPSAEAAYVQTLASKFTGLRFPAEQEAAYRDHNADQRQDRLTIMAVLGLFIYNVYIFNSRAMFPDIQRSTLLWQIGLSTALVLMTAAARMSKISVLRREALYSLGTSVMGVVSAWVLSQSQQLTTLAFSVCLVLIPMFSGVGARQPFRFTCVPAVITCLAAFLFLRPVGPLQTLVFADSIMMIATNTLFTLILAYTLENGARKDWLLCQIERLQGEALQVLTRTLHESSMLDPLTGIFNRRQFDDDFQRIWAESRQDQRPMAMLIIDVDFFKLYNDGYGHPAGDHCLKQVAAAISQVAQDGKGIAARLGGEEFGILLPNADAEQALQLGERVCLMMRQAGIEHRHSKVLGEAIVTVSVGVASLMAEKSTNRSTLFTIADDALYQAKSAGRNRVVAFAQPAPCPAPTVFTREFSRRP